MAAVSKVIGSRATTEQKLFWRSLLSIGFTLLASQGSDFGVSEAV